MRWSFRTNGNFIDFVHTDETSLAVESTIVSLHNTSRAVSWSLPEDTTRISFTIDEVKYSNIPITDIDFDGTAMNSQDDFQTGIEAMFPGLAGGGGLESVTAGDGIDVDDTDPANPIISATGGAGYFEATLELNDTQIKALPSLPITMVAAPGANKMLMILNCAVYANILGVYTNRSADMRFYMLYGDFTTIATAISDFDSTVNEFAFILPPLVWPITTGTWAGYVEGNNTYGGPVNTSLMFNMENQGMGDLTGGNAGNRLKVVIHYVIVDFNP